MREPVTVTGFRNYNDSSIFPHVANCRREGRREGKTQRGGKGGWMSGKERESVCVSEKDKEKSGTFSFHECLKL